MAERNSSKDVKHLTTFQPIGPAPSDPMDNIVNAVKASNSGTWGYAIYRCTYEDDKDFAKLLELLIDHMRDYLEFDGKYTYLLDSFQWIIFDDRTQFDGASKAYVRDHYDKWTRSSEAGVSQSERNKQYSRYRLAIHVDLDALNAVVHKAPPPGVGRAKSLHWIGYVNLVNLDWEHEDPNSINPNFLITKYRVQKMKKPDKNVISKEDVKEEKGLIINRYPEIDGCIAWQVGWCKIRAGALITVYAMLLQGAAFWEWVYDRPPDVTDSDPVLEAEKARRKETLRKAGFD